HRMVDGGPRTLLRDGLPLPAAVRAA
ncbi:MAG: hypothetical protein QOJ29_796, partial [Thermoleophilaceae bacterium]|nr:hypothetical protein [Thermoleophilaceae bacterium]